VSEREVREINERIPRTRIFARALALFSLFARERVRERLLPLKRMFNGSDDDNDNVIREGIPKTTFSPNNNASSSSLRFRFRSTSLPKSPSLDKMLMLAEDEDEDEHLLASDSSPSFAKFVEPPELPTLLIHKVFGERCAFFLFLFFFF